MAAAAVVQGAPAGEADHKRSIVEKNGVTYNVFEHRSTGAKMEYVKNSGICETTEGVNQYSGYLSVGDNMNMWFWFFEARNDPTTAPLAAWFNGGPGCSSMIGLFQENGPCHFVNGSSEPSLNEYSFNEYANMLYVDQPIGVGFSYGTDDVTSTVTAAPYVWNLLQAFFAEFTTYESRDFGIFTESYGGHYGPEFAYYIQDQNAAIANGTLTDAETINLVALGINNGWYDEGLQNQAYIDYALNNSYNQLITEEEAAEYQTALDDKCTPLIDTCYSTGTSASCIKADSVCYSAVEGPITSGSDFDVYDVREPSNDPYPPETYATYLANSDVVSAIGAQSTYSECPSKPYYKFETTGDDARSFLDELSSVVQSGINVLIWAGDADFICNWLGSQYVVNAVTFDGQKAFRAAELEPYTVDGTEKGTFKTQGNFSFLRAFEAGHEVPYYQPELALQVFKQTMQQKAIYST
ncbi:putative carboxypeptidase S1 [Saccharata proteae CBS 121410]|uniref:Carboxypeptidase n=1 Tax=Saccharata proteae CBS 121410 TaxID=1314787 RepID=A0A9P4HY05_9PEZI|nr:putative carboxypeptidase S1 [Saccharata proteae CBS 121410]